MADRVPDQTGERRIGFSLPGKPEILGAILVALPMPALAHLSLNAQLAVWAEA